MPSILVRSQELINVNPAITLMVEWMFPSFACRKAINWVVYKFRTATVSNLRSARHFGDRWKSTAVLRVTEPDLLKSYVVLFLIRVVVPGFPYFHVTELSMSKIKHVKAFQPKNHWCHLRICYRPKAQR